MRRSSKRKGQAPCAVFSFTPLSVKWALFPPFQLFTTTSSASSFPALQPTRAVLHQAIQAPRHPAAGYIYQAPFLSASAFTMCSLHLPFPVFIHSVFI